MERAVTFAPHGRVHPEPELVDEPAVHEHAGKLAATDQSQIACAFLQLGDAVDDVSGDERGIPLERALRAFATRRSRR